MKYQGNQRSAGRTLAAAKLLLMVLALGLGGMAARPATAAWTIQDAAAGGPDDEELLVLLWVDTETGVGYLQVINKDGSVNYYPLVNPNPVDGSTTPGDESSWGQLLKQKGGLGYLTPEFWETPVGQALANSGYGISNYHNPSDGDSQGGGLSPSSIKFKHPLEDALIIGGRGSLSGFEFDGTGGSLSEQLKTGGKKQGTNNDDDDDDSSPQGSPVFDDFMVGPPELINPNPTHEISEFEVFLLMLELLDETQDVE